ncbi:hypothetical protein BSKO_12149 [Bryopsis sp. KO-2023]|nr:hypothetical protein BSKO_12149 [Bryopsis sp. KO-2023]
MPGEKHAGALNLVTKFYTAPLFGSSKGVVAEVIRQNHQEGSQWSTCGNDVMKALIGHLRASEDGQSVRNLRLVNRHWCSTVSGMATSMKPADLEIEEFGKFEKAMRTRFTNIRKLELPASWMEDSFCQRIAAFKGLRELDFFWFDNVTDEGMKHIASLPNLSSLKIYHCRQVSDKGLKMLARSTIKELWLYGGVQVSDDGLSMLASCNSLKQLRLMYCNAITKRGLESFVNRPDMKLTVRFCRRIPCDIHIA